VGTAQFGPKGRGPRFEIKRLRLRRGQEKTARRRPLLEELTIEHRAQAAFSEKRGKDSSGSAETKSTFSISLASARVFIAGAIQGCVALRELRLRGKYYLLVRERISRCGEFATPMKTHQ